MKTNMFLFRVSILDFLLLMLFNIIVFVGLIFGLNRMMDQFSLSGTSSSWIVILPFIIIYPLLRSFGNRNGVLIIKDEQAYLFKSDYINKYLIKKGYVVAQQNNAEIMYDKKNRLSRFLNFIFREYIRMKYENNEVLIYAKRNQLNELVRKIEELNVSS